MLVNLTKVKFKAHLLPIYWLFIAVTALSSHIAYAEITLNNSQSYKKLSHYIEYIIESEQSYSFEEISNNKTATWHHFKESNDDPNFGFIDYGVWLKLSVNNQTNTKDWIIQTNYSLIDYIQVYIKKSNGEVIHYKAGDQLPFSQRPIYHREFLFNLPLEHKETVDIYIHVKTTSSTQVPVTLLPVATFLEQDQRELTIQGLYFGAMLVMAAFVFATLILVRELTYIYYVSFIIFMALFQAFMHGYTFQYLWPNSTWMQHYAIFLLLNSMIISALLFWCSFLSLKDHWPLAEKLLKIQIIILFLLSIGSLIGPYHLFIKLCVIAGAIAVISSLIIGIQLSFKQYRSAKLFVIAWSSSIIGGVIFALNKSAIIPYSFFSEYALQIGSIIEIILLSVAIADRISQEEIGKMTAQSEALAAEKKLNIQLEKDVKQRTAELEKTNKQLEKLSHIDPLTGLNNRRSFYENYKLQMSNENIIHMPFSVLMIDIDYFKNINDTYGHLAGDDCLRIVGAILKNSVKREFDSVTRYGGEEFAVSLPCTSLKNAEMIAERIRKAIEEAEMIIEGARVPITTSIGVACLRPFDIKNPMQLIDHADDALYKAKRQGRNRVICAPENLAS